METSYHENNFSLGSANLTGSGLQHHVFRPQILLQNW